MNVGNVNGNELVEEEVDSRIMTDSGEKNLSEEMNQQPLSSLKSQPTAAFTTSVKQTKFFVFMLVMCAFCFLQSDRYCGGLLCNCLAR